MSKENNDDLKQTLKLIQEKLGTARITERSIALLKELSHKTKLVDAAFPNDSGREMYLQLLMAAETLSSDVVRALECLEVIYLEQTTEDIDITSFGGETLN